MSKEFFHKMIDNKVRDLYSGEPDFMLLSYYKDLVKDSSYFDFLIESHNGGFFYRQSMHIYSYSHNRDYNDIEQVNAALKRIYGELFTGLESFGQDLFGNQFCFDTANGNRIIFFNSETGKREEMAPDFMSWLDVIYQNFGYYIGMPLITEWWQRNSFEFNERLCPKVPFVSSGDFSVRNLKASPFPDFLEDYEKIARQVHHLPEGTTVKIAYKK